MKGISTRVIFDDGNSMYISTSCCQIEMHSWYIGLFVLQTLCNLLEIRDAHKDSVVGIVSTYRVSLTYDGSSVVPLSCMKVNQTC